jgi:hypothetical protein
LGLDFIACTDSSCEDGFAFVPPDSFDSIFVAGFSFGSLGEPFVLANYSLTPAGTHTVPEPATVLGLLSIAGVGLLSKRQKSEK